MWCFEIGHPPLFSLNFQKITPPYLGNRSSNQRQILDLMFGGWNQHVCQISLHYERVGFRIVFFWVIWHGTTLLWYDRVSKQFCQRASWAITQQFEGWTSYVMWLFQDYYILPINKFFIWILVFHWQNSFAGRIWPVGRPLPCLKYLFVLSFKPIGYEEIVKTNVLFGKFIDPIFYVIQCLRANAPWKFIEAPCSRTTALTIFWNCHAWKKCICIWFVKTYIFFWWEDWYFLKNTLFLIKTRYYVGYPFESAIDLFQ